MIALFCPDESDLLERMKIALQGERLVAAGTWEAVRNRARMCRCAVIALRMLTSTTVDEFRVLSVCAPAARTILVTNPDPDSLVLLKDIIVSEVIWIGRIDQELYDAVKQSGVGDFLRSAARILRSGDDAPLLRAALVHAMTAAHPVVSVKKLAQVVSRSPDTLQRQWRCVAEGRTALRLEDVLDMVTLARFLDLRGGGATWDRAAAGAGVTKATIKRYASHVPSDTRDLRSPEFRADFERWLREQILPIFNGEPEMRHS